MQRLATKQNQRWCSVDSKFCRNLLRDTPQPLPLCVHSLQLSLHCLLAFKWNKWKQPISQNHPKTCDWLTECFCPKGLCLHRAREAPLVPYFAGITMVFVIWRCRDLPVFQYNINLLTSGYHIVIARTV